MSGPNLLMQQHFCSVLDECWPDGYLLRRPTGRLVGGRSQSCLLSDMPVLSACISADCRGRRVTGRPPPAQSPPAPSQRRRSSRGGGCVSPGGPADWPGPARRDALRADQAPAMSAAGPDRWNAGARRGASLLRTGSDRYLTGHRPPPTHVPGPTAPHTERLGRSAAERPCRPGTAPGTAPDAASAVSWRRLCRPRWHAAGT